MLPDPEISNAIVASGRAVTAKTVARSLHRNDCNLCKTIFRILCFISRSFALFTKNWWSVVGVRVYQKQTQNDSNWKRKQCKSFSWRRLRRFLVRRMRSIMMWVCGMVVLWSCLLSLHESYALLFEPQRPIRFCFFMYRITCAAR